MCWANTSRPPGRSIYEKYVKPLIVKAWDVTYIEYFRRGLEELPEEITPAYDWMDRHRRDPYPKSFKAYTARTSDARFYGIVVRDFSPGRTTAPEAADVLGPEPQSRHDRDEVEPLSNLMRLEVNGIKSLDVWLSPKLIDFKRRVEIRIHDRPYFKGQIKLDNRVDARGRPRPRRPAATLLASHHGGLIAGQGRLRVCTSSPWTRVSRSRKSYKTTTFR